MAFLLPPLKVYIEFRDTREKDGFNKIYGKTESSQ